MNRCSVSQRIRAARVCLLAAGWVLAACAATAGADPACRIGLNFVSSQLGSGPDAVSERIPPDTMGTVGPNHIVEMINGRYRVYDKQTGSLLESRSLDSFWATYGVRPRGTVSFDPRVVYDSGAQRYYAVSVDNSHAANNIHFAVSRTSNPLDGWAGFRMASDTDGGRWADFPTLGFNADTVCVAVNMFPLSPNLPEVSVLAIPKQDLLASTPTLTGATYLEDVQATTPQIPQSVIDLDDSHDDRLLFSGASNAALKSRLTPVTGGYQVSQNGAVYLGPASMPPDGQQGGAKADLDNADLRFSSALVRQAGTVWGVQTIADPETGRSAVRWFQADPDSFLPIQQGLVSFADLDLLYPSIAVSKEGKVVIGFSATGEDLFPSACAVVGETDGLRDTTFGDLVMLREGQAGYEVTRGTGRNRWGDYSATVVDPDAPDTFWTFQEFCLAEDVWATNITQIIVPEPTSGMLLLTGLWLLWRRRPATTQHLSER